MLCALGIKLLNYLSFLFFFLFVSGKSDEIDVIGKTDSLIYIDE